MSEQTQVRRWYGSWLSVVGYPATALGGLAAFTGGPPASGALFVGGVVFVVGGEIVSEMRRSRT